MASFFAFYGRPEDVEGFERHYREVHVPMIDTVDGVREVRVRRTTGTPRGGAPAYHLVTEIAFDDDGALQSALASEAFRNVGKDAAGMCKTFGVDATMLLAEDL